MSPATAVAQAPAAPKMKRPVPPGIQTNGTIASTSSPSPSLANKKTPNAAKQPSTTPSTDRPISASTGRPIIRVRRDPNGRHSRNSAGIRTGEAGGDGAKNHGPMPYVVTDSYVLKKHAGSPPSLVAHLHATHFRFDGQDGMFPYKSPMKLFLEHVRSRTIPHDLLPYLVQANVPFYDGCLIVQLHDHKSAAQSKDETVTASKTKTVASSIHNYNPWLTPSPYVPFPTDQQHGADENADAENKLKSEGEGDAVAPLPENKSKPPTKAKVFTVVLHPTPESLQYDLMLKATTAKPSGGDGAGPPSTPLSLVPPTPTAGNMPPPAKRAKKEKTELDGSTIYAAEGQILLATTAPLMLEPTKSAEETAALLEAMAHPKNSDPLPEPNSRKRTVAEVAADEAAAAEQERYMLVLDERLSSSANGAQGAGADGDAQTGGAAFEPRFERFKLINDIIRDHAEKKEQEKIKQQENDKRLQQQRQQQQEQMVAQRQADMERARQAAAAREAQAQAQAHQQQQAQAAEAQRQAMAARQAAAVQAAANNAQNMAQAHGHPGAMPNGVNAAAQAMGAQQRFPQQMQAAQASSPVVRQPTPQNMSSPMVGSAPMQQTNSGMAGSPPRPPSAAPGAMSAPMAPSMSVRGSQQSHTAGTPRMPNATPNMSQATPINRGQMNATPRMSQASPPPNMMAQNSQMGQNMMMQAGQNMSPPNPQVIAQLAAQQRHLAQQHQMAAMQNGGAGGVPNMNNMSQQQQQQMLQIMQRQFAMQQQQQAQAAQQQQQAGMMNPQQQQQWAQYAQQLQNMQGNQMRQMTPQMQAQLQAQMARMGQVPAGAAMPNAAMQRQMSAQMMNGNNANMQNMAMQMQQQQQQQQQAQQQGQQFVQQQGQQMPMGQQQPGMQQNLIQQQLNNSARTIYQKLMASAAARFGSTENIPPETIEKLKAASMSQAQQMLQASIAQRRAQQMMQQQQQQQQQQAMQGMGGMMGQQGMQ